jgi:hypothetical protein
MKKNRKTKRYEIFLEDHAGFKDYSNLDDLFVMLRKVIKNHDFKTEDLRFRLKCR